MWSFKKNCNKCLLATTPCAHTIEPIVEWELEKLPRHFALYSVALALCIYELWIGNWNGDFFPRYHLSWNFHTIHLSLHLSHLLDGHFLPFLSFSFNPCIVLYTSDLAFKARDFFHHHQLNNNKQTSHLKDSREFFVAVFVCMQASEW